jgi:hypothetical protein
MSLCVKAKSDEIAEKTAIILAERNSGESFHNCKIQIKIPIPNAQTAMPNLWYPPAGQRHNHRKDIVAISGSLESPALAPAPRAT